MKKFKVTLTNHNYGQVVYGYSSKAYEPVEITAEYFEVSEGTLYFYADAEGVASFPTGRWDSVVRV